MANVINATSTGNGGLVSTGDDSGILNIQTNETTAITVDASQNTTFAGKVTSAGALTLASNGTTTAVTIDTSQNVGIGTTSPSAKLHVSGGQSYVTGASSAGAYSRWYNNAQTTGDFQVGQGWLSVSDNIGVLCNNANAAMILGTNATERMRINSSGQLLISTSTVYNTATTNVGFVGNVGSGISINSTTNTNGATYQVFLTTGTLIGSISNNNNTGVLYNVTSDYRLKNNAVALTGAKDFVMALKPKTWDWYNDLGKGVGFLAHEFMEVAKYSGHGEKDAVDSDGKPIYQTIQASSTEVMANIVALMQEQQATTTAQAETINALTARIVALETA